MIIGIDIDGVLTDIEKFELDYGSKYMITKFNKTIVNPNGGCSKKIYNLTDEEDNEFWSEAIYDYIKIKPRDYASEVIEKLKNEGNKIYIITNRTSDLSYCDITIEEMKNYVTTWLNENNIYYDKIIFSNGTKENDIIDNKVDIMIEDKIQNIEKLSQYIPVICYDNRNNNKCTNNNIIHCYSWYDIYYKIKGLK